MPFDTPTTEARSLTPALAQIEVRQAWRRYLAEYDVAKGVKMYRADPTLSHLVSQFFFTGVPTTEEAFASAEGFRQVWLAKKAEVGQ
ncbi:MAG: hypothetical protein Q7T61_01110 [Caulobacter sp.]|nr:hypothetical protein [Caulobacter sp.]